MIINRIELTNVLPRVFAAEPPAHSDVWRTTLSLERGNYYMIEATSGGGKSSLCAYLYGLRNDYQGIIRFDSKDTRQLRIAEWQELRRRHLAYLPQELGLFPQLTARENIDLKNRLTGHLPQQRIDDMMRLLGIADRADSPCGRMSVGQQQRVAIIRALCQPFDFLILDEPVSHLDAENNAIAASLVMEEAQKNGAAVITTSVGNPLSISNPKILKL